MPLSFPNKSRAFDATRRAVRFWGYDSAMEVAFFVTEEALKRVQPDMQSDEAGLLRAFDSNWALICRMAAKIYARGRRGSYDLVGADFWPTPRELAENSANRWRRRGIIARQRRSIGQDDNG